MITKLKEEYIVKYCEDKKYTVNKTQRSGYLRIDISNLRERININLSTYPDKYSN